MLLQGAEGYGVRRKRPGEDMGGEGEADQPELTAPSKPLTPDLTATTANGPIARVPAPMVGAPGPVLKAPEPIATPQAPQSVAGIALGTSAPKVNMAPPAAPGQPPAGPTPQVGAPEPIKTLSGEWTPPTAAAGSAPLIASAAGGTMSAAGDKDNSFRGYKTDQNGGFGGYGSAIMPDTGTTMKDYDAKVGQAIKSFDFNFSEVNPAELSRLSAMTTNANGAETDQADALKLKLFKGGQLTPTEQYFLAYQSGQTPQIFRPTYGASGASPTGWNLSQNDLNALGGAKTRGEWSAKQAPVAPPPENAGNWTAKDPAEQARLLEQMRTGAIPSGPAPQVGPPITPMPAETGVLRPGGAQTTTVPAGGGGGAPAVGVGPSGTPAFPSTPSPSVGAPGDLTDLDPVQKAMRDETLRRLQNPSPYDDALWQKEVDRAKASSEEQWKRGRDNLDADLAARGINWSSIAGDKLSDFNTAKARSWDDVLTGFLSDRAKGIGSARDQAFNAGSTERNYYDNLRQQAIANQFDVTKLGEALRQGQEGTAIDWTRLGLDALGNSTSGAADLGAGAAASAGNTGTGDYLAQWLAQFYGNKLPKPGVGTPAPATAGAYG